MPGVPAASAHPECRACLPRVRIPNAGRARRARLYCSLVGAFLPNFLQLLFFALYVLILGRVLMSWVNPRFDSALGRFLYETTEPILQPIRRVLPSTGMIDFSPIVAFLLLSVLAAALRIG